MSGSFNDLLVEDRGPVRTLCMNRPAKRNALNAGLVAELITAFREADQNPDVRAVILTGSGGAFCAGADLSLLGATDPSDHSQTGANGFPELNLVMRRMGTPVIARIERYAFAGALSLVCNATFAIAERTARFAAPEIDRGLFPMMVLASLFRTVNRRDGMDLVLTGRTILAPEAERMGLIHRSVEANELETAVNELAATLAAKPPGAMRLGLKAIEDQSQWDFETALQQLHGRLAEALNTEEAQQGIADFLDKQSPKN